MSMNPMSPKAALPPAPAFRLLADLNEFFAHPLKERQAALDGYMAAEDQRQAALDIMEADTAMAAVDRAAAAKTKAEAEEAARATVTEAHAKANGIVGAATAQAESVNETVRENVARAKADSETWSSRLKKREDAVQDREDACEVREANAFKDREDAVLSREQAVEEADIAAKRLSAQAHASKDAYDALIADFNALQARAPK